MQDSERTLKMYIIFMVAKQTKNAIVMKKGIFHMLLDRKQSVARCATYYIMVQIHKRF